MFLEKFGKVLNSYWPKFFKLLSNNVCSLVRIYKVFSRIDGYHMFDVDDHRLDYKMDGLEEDNKQVDYKMDGLEEDNKQDKGYDCYGSRHGSLLFVGYEEFTECRKLYGNEQ